MHQAGTTIVFCFAAITPGDEDSGDFVDLMSAAQDQPGEPLEREELQKQVQQTVMGMPEHLRVSIGLESENERFLRALQVALHA